MTDTNEAGLHNAAVHAGLAEGEIPITSGDLEAQETEATAEAETTEADEQPPRSGSGSGREAWADYAGSHGVEVTDDMSRDDIVAAVDDS